MSISLAFRCVLAVGLFTAPPFGQGDKAPVQPDGLKNLRHPDANVRYGAAALLVEQGPRARFAIAELRGALGDTDPLVRVKVAEAIWAVERPSPSVIVPTLQRALKEKDPQVRAAACGVLGLLGSKSKHALPALTDTLWDKDLTVVIAAVTALGDIGPTAHKSAPALLGLSSYSDFAILEPLVGAALGNMGDAVVPELTAALKAGSQERRRVAAYAQGSIGVPARSAVPALERLLREEQPALRFLAARALGSIGREAKGALPRLRDATLDMDAGVRVRAALAVWQIAGETRYAGLLAGALREPSLTTRTAAAEALAAMGADAKQAVPALVRALKDVEPAVKQAATDALAAIGPPARAAAPELRLLLKDADRKLRQHAAYALWRVTGEAKEAVAILRGLLDEDPRVAEKLGLMGPAARDALPDLVTLYREQDNTAVRRTLGAAIRLIDAALAAKLGIR